MYLPVLTQIFVPMPDPVFLLLHLGYITEILSVACPKQDSRLAQSIAIQGTALAFTPVVLPRAHTSPCACPWGPCSEPFLNLPLFITFSLVQPPPVWHSRPWCCPLAAQVILTHKPISLPLLSKSNGFPSYLSSRNKLSHQLTLPCHTIPPAPKRTKWGLTRGLCPGCLQASDDLLQSSSFRASPCQPPPAMQPEGPFPPLYCCAHP